MNDWPEVLRVDHHLTLENPFAVHCYYASRARSMAGADTHYALQIGVILSGCFEIAYADRVMELVSGQVWLTSCWEPHTCRATRNFTTNLVVTIIPESLGNVAPFGRFNWLAPFAAPSRDRPQTETVAERRRMINIGRDIRSLNRKRPPGWRLAQWLKIHDLILALTQGWERNDNAVKSADGLPDPFGRVLPAVRMAKDGATVSVEQAAAACGMSRSRFCEVFKSVMGVGFGKFVSRGRLAKAARELTSSAIPIKEVAAKWGFFDVSHFHHAFKDCFGCPPSEYRRKKRLAGAETMNEQPISFIP